MLKTVSATGKGTDVRGNEEYNCPILALHFEIMKSTCFDEATCVVKTLPR